MITFQYVVTMNEDGTINTQAIEASESIRRKPTTYDVYVTSKEIADNIESQMLAERVANIVAALISPADPSAEIKKKLIDALSDRGIETPKNQ